MTDDASLTDFLDDGGSDESEDAADSETSERANDTASGGEPTDRDTSDDVADDDTAIAETGSASGDDTGPETDDGRVPPATVEPAASTAAWSADGAACDDCGSVVPYRWEGDGGLVCPNCKEW